MVDCSTDNYGCNGGFTEAAWQYLASNGGQCTGAAYPYQAVDGTCQESNCTKAATLSQTDTVLSLPDEKSIMTELSKNGLVSIAFTVVDSFYSYS